MAGAGAPAAGAPAAAAAPAARAPHAGEPAPAAAAARRRRAGGGHHRHVVPHLDHTHGHSLHVAIVPFVPHFILAVLLKREDSFTENFILNFFASLFKNKICLELLII